jgi:hypothetical protein
VTSAGGLELPASPAALAQALAGTGYPADKGLATAGYLALRPPGMTAVLPYLDDFVAGHSLAALEELVRVIAHA